MRFRKLSGLLFAVGMTASVTGALAASAGGVAVGGSGAGPQRERTTSPDQGEQVQVRDRQRVRGKDVEQQPAQDLDGTRPNE